MKRFSVWIASLALVLGGSCAYLPQVIAGEEAGQGSLGFPERLDEAYQFRRLGQWKKAIAAYEKLLQANPEEFLVHDAYAQTFAAKGDFMRAVDIYQDWLRHYGKEPQAAGAVAEKIEGLKAKESFQQLMGEADPWEKATVSGTIEFTVKSNVPNPYRQQVLSQFLDMVRAEKKLFAEIFGDPVEHLAFMKIYIVGRNEDYGKALEELGYPGAPPPHQAFYLRDQATIVIYFNGGLDLPILAHEASHHILYTHYVPNPSWLLDEGFAEYVAYKIAKPVAQDYLHGLLEKMNWLFDQGAWDDLSDVFDAWFQYAQIHERGAIMTPEKHLRLHQAKRLLYFGGWTLVHFLIEGGGDSMREVFTKWVAYERNQEVNDYETGLRFFKEHLTPEEQEALNEQWLDHVLNLTFEKI